MFTLGTAAKHVGKSKPTISKAIKDGRLSATKVNGVYQIEPSELLRVFPTKPVQETTPAPTVTTDILQVKVDMLEAQLLREQETVGDLRSRLDRAEERMLQLTHREPAETPKMGWWGRLRGL
ncbi:excisionase family DNA binding protein [Pelagimonas varians]|uniref:Helix-turn-helix domain protein n=1 Tax=Pelagimonas varians TaxID=696760 RepID=A0A238L6I9_9RHOB|nr:excisionase family DNA binding protein [Pelagimonas varians]SMX50714.1 hypothetical protein PEV8663_04775 [Pelagimonas varians]